jgi:glycosyltransferase involved in cell wall biosynthesis
MKIGWASPWNADSAIAVVGAQVAEKLADRGHSITVLRTETGEPLARPPLNERWPVLDFSSLPMARLRNDFDVIIAQIGNHFPYHGALVGHLAGVGAIGIFHDAVLAHLVAEWAETLPPRSRSETLRPLVAELYGTDVWPEGQHFLSTEILGEIARRRPMLEWLARDTIAAVAHAAHYRGRLASACLGPVTVIPLSAVYEDLPPPPPRSSSGLTVGVVGYAVPTKQIDQLVKAIGASPVLRDRCRIKVIGAIDARQQARLEDIGRAFGTAPIEFTGWVSDAVLREQLEDVDVISCLRNPIFEGASASVILAMASGRPTLVSNHGSFADLPADCVLHCRPGSEALDVIRHLERVLRDPEWARAMGHRAMAHAATHFTPGRYAAALDEFITTALRPSLPRDVDQQFATDIAGMGLGPSDPLLGRARGAVSGLLGKSISAAGAG